MNSTPTLSVPVEGAAQRGSGNPAVVPETPPGRQSVATVSAGSPLAPAT